MMTKMVGSLSLAAVAVIAVALMAGPAHARGGLTAETVELLPVGGISLCDESIDSVTCEPNANASAVTAYESKRNPAPTSTVWTAIAEDLLPNRLYGLYNLNDENKTISQLTDADCDSDLDTPVNFIGTFGTNIDGNLPDPTRIDDGSALGAPATDIVFVCRETPEVGLPTPRLILSSQLGGGASGGGKDKNRRNK
jgi:hypothetical protein